MCACMEYKQKDEPELMCNQPFHLGLPLENLFNIALGRPKATFKAQRTEGCSSLKGFQTNETQS